MAFKVLGEILVLVNIIKKTPFERFWRQTMHHKKDIKKEFDASARLRNKLEFFKLR